MQTSWRASGLCWLPNPHRQHPAGAGPLSRRVPEVCSKTCHISANLKNHWKGLEVKPSVWGNHLRCFFSWNLDLNKEARAYFPNITSSEAEREGTLTEPLSPSCGIGGTAVGAWSPLQAEEAGAIKQYHKTDAFQKRKLGLFFRAKTSTAAFWTVPRWQQGSVLHPASAPSVCRQLAQCPQLPALASALLHWSVIPLTDARWEKKQQIKASHWGKLDKSALIYKQNKNHVCCYWKAVS